MRYSTFLPLNFRQRAIDEVLVFWYLVADRSMKINLYSFNDPYSALNVIDLGYIGNRGIVFHDARSARIACAALQKAE